MTTSYKKTEEYVKTLANMLRNCTDIQKAYLEGYVKGLEKAQEVKKAS